MLYNLALLLPCTVCLFGAVWLLCKRQSNTRAQKILTLCLFLSGVFYFCNASYIVGVPDYITYRRLDILDCFVTPFIIPTMYLYFRALTDEGHFTWKDYIWFLPSLVVGVGTFVLYMAMDTNQVAGYITTVLINKSDGSEYTAPIYKLHHLFSLELYTSISLLQLVGTATCTIINLRRYHQRLQEFYSALDDKSIYFDNALLIWFIAIIPFTFSIILVKETFWQQNLVLASLFFVGYSTVYFGIFYYGSQRKYTVENLAEDLQQADFEAIRNQYDSQEEDNVDDTGKTADTGRYARHLALFNKLINEELIFLQSNLRADELASRMYTNRTYLSRMLKEEFKCTFSDYINRQRIEYSQKLMRENPDIKLVELAENSGFININSFGRTFKQFAGLPPKEWLKKNISKL